MKHRDYAPLIAQLSKDYAQHAPTSKAINERAKRHLVDGGSHTLRLMKPFPPRIVSARGAWLKDEDSNQILDFWQGHLGNILGHNPTFLTETLSETLRSGYGLQTGFTDQLQAEAAETLCKLAGTEKVRFTTSGALATMYSIMLARAHTDRSLVMKVGGGWHGAQPWALKGVGYHQDSNGGFQEVESAGLPVSVTDKVLVTEFNNTEQLEVLFQEYGDQLACFILEPFLGAGGFMPATVEFMEAARELCNRYGVVLVCDEVIAGFRFHAGSTTSLYNIEPDLYTFGKIIGGGMPVAAVAGINEIMCMVGEEGSAQVKFSGGTYSAHPAAMLASKTLLTHLSEHEDEIYPRLAHLGALVRERVVRAFTDEGIAVQCTGNDPNALPGSSMFMLHFPYDASAILRSPRDWFNPAVCDVTLSHQVLDLALLVEDVVLVHGHGALSVAHTEKDIETFGAACQRVARRVKSYL